MTPVRRQNLVRRDPESSYAAAFIVSVNHSRESALILAAASISADSREWFTDTMKAAA